MSFQSFTLDVADEGDTLFTSSREGSDLHPPPCEAQCRLQVSMPMEGSVQLEMKRKRGRPAAQTPPRTHLGALSQAATELSTSSSDPEPLEPLPLRQQEDLEPSTAEHRGEEAGVVHVSVWGGCAKPHRGESPKAGSGPEAKAGLTPPIFHTAVRVPPMLGVLWDSLGIFLSPYTHIKMLAMGNLLFSHSSSTVL